MTHTEGIILERFKQSHIANTTPTPLACYLYIYNHSFSECYVNYMEGAKILAKYLAPIDIPIATTTIPNIFVSYELVELARVLLPHTDTPRYINTSQIERAIYEHLTQSR